MLLLLLKAATATGVAAAKMSDREQQSEVEKIEAQRMKQQRQQAQQMLPAWKVQQLRQRSEKLFECPSPRVGSWAVKKARASDSDGRDDASSSLLSSSVRPSSSAAARGGGGAGAGAGAGAGGGFSSRRGRAAAASVSASGPRAKSSWKSRNNNDSNGADDTSGRAPPTPGEYSDKEQKLLAKLNRKLVLQRKPNRVKSGLRNHHFKAGPAVVNTTKLGVLAARQPRPKVCSGCFVCVCLGRGGVTECCIHSCLLSCSVVHWAAGCRFIARAGDRDWPDHRY